MRVRVTLLFVAAFATWVWLDGRAQTNAPVVSGAHQFEKVTEGIYYTTASGTMNVGANSPIILTDDEALVIDSEITPAAARALVADMKAVTPKPVRTGTSRGRCSRLCLALSPVILASMNGHSAARVNSTPGSTTVGQNRAGMV